MSVYVVDTNFFIQAHRDNYPLDVVPSFWNKVKQLAEEDKIISIDKVKNEIYLNDDNLKLWCTDNLPNDFFKDTTGMIEQYRHVTTWALSKKDHYLPKALAEFLDADDADAWLLSYALERSDNRILVTHEISEPNRKSKIKIPDVCSAMGIKFTNTIKMFRQLGEHF